MSKIDRLQKNDFATYRRCMAENSAYLKINLDLNEPVEASDFAALFAGFSDDFEDYLRGNHPDLAGESKIYVRKVKDGSIIADLFADAKHTIAVLDSGLIILAFAALFNKRVRDFIQGKRSGDNKVKLTNVMRSLRALANDPNGRMTLTGFRWKDSWWAQEFEAVLTANDARDAIKTIEGEIVDLQAIGHSDRKRVLMAFTRSDVGEAKVGKNTGERVVIEELHKKPLALTYASELAEERIKHEIREADENVFKKGFMVDVNVKTVRGKPAAYAVVEVHDVFDLPDDD